MMNTRRPWVSAFQLITSHLLLQHLRVHHLGWRRLVIMMLHADELRGRRNTHGHAHACRVHRLIWRRQLASRAEVILVILKLFFAVAAGKWLAILLRFMSSAMSVEN
jgi:hypothetical protein